MSKAQDDFEEALGSNRQHTNKQTFGVDSTTLIAEVIDTPGVDIAGKLACLITVVSVLPDLGTAGNVVQTGFRTQFCGGVQAALLMPDNPKFIGEKHIRNEQAAAGVGGIMTWPMIFANPTKPMLVVNPQMTILHKAIVNAPDWASEDIYTRFSYTVIPLSLEMHTSMLHAQMDLT